MRLTVFLISIVCCFMQSALCNSVAAGEIWYDLILNDTFFTPEETFFFERACGNPTDAELDVKEFIALEAGSLFFFWPEWKLIPGYLTFTMTAYQDYSDPLLQFQWPFGAGSASELRFWGAIVESKTGDLLDYDMIEWGYGM